MRPRVRGGFSLAEALVSLLLVGVVVQGAWWLAARMARGGGWVAERAEGLEAVRTLAWVLSEELAGGEEGWAWWGEAGGDSVALRAFRGWGLVEGGEPAADRIRVCYRGLRSPDPGKDSVVALGGGGLWTVHALAARRWTGRPCSHPAAKVMALGQQEVWTLAPGPAGEGPIVVRLFERGSYHLTEGALRYRRGGGGRQPLTPERLAEGGLPGGGRRTWRVVLDGEGWKGLREAELPGGGQHGHAPGGGIPGRVWQGVVR